MTNLIYQVAVGPQNPLYEFCIASVADYCQRYDITHIVQREPVLKIRPDNSHRSSQAVERLGYLPIYEKENAFDLFDQYDDICIVDSDIYIADHAPNIFLELEDYEFGGVAERDMPLNFRHVKKIRKYSEGQYGSLREQADFKWNSMGAEFYNMGLMLCSNQLKKYLNGETAYEFLTREEFKPFVDGVGQWRWSTDQTLLNYWVKRYNIKTKNLDWRWNALYRGIEDQYLPEAYFIHFFNADHIPKDRTVEQIIAEIYQ
jgi:lipopolysaccharide biosynthesis glycosyltransferase